MITCKRELLIIKCIPHHSKARNLDGIIDYMLTEWNPHLCPSKGIIFSIIYMNSLGKNILQTVWYQLKYWVMIKRKPENYRTYLF